MVATKPRARMSIRLIDHRTPRMARKPAARRMAGAGIFDATSATAGRENVFWLTRMLANGLDRRPKAVDAFKVQLCARESYDTESGAGLGVSFRRMSYH